jgi:hypothetical protein
LPSRCSLQGRTPLPLETDIHKQISLCICHLLSISTGLSTIKSIVNSSNMSSMVISHKFLIQFRPCSSIYTDFLLYLLDLNRLGAKSLGGAPFSHRSSQSGVDLPSPTSTDVEQKKICQISGSSIFSKFFQGFSC